MSLFKKGIGIADKGRHAKIAINVEQKTDASKLSGTSSEITDNQAMELRKDGNI